MKEITIYVSFKYARNFYEKNLEEAINDFNTYGGSALEKAYEKAFNQLELFKFYKEHPFIKMVALETYLDLLHMFATYFSEVDTYDGGTTIEIGC